MSSLAAGFAARISKRVASAQGETSPGFDVPDGKHPKWLGLNGEVQKSPTVVI